jgi:2-polyprenyl-3-methyl-5-hydroxy-6-metoxy-1,4-benzoquinol methylase
MQMMPDQFFRLLPVFLCLSLSPFSVEAAPHDKERWDNKYDTDTFLSGKTPIPFLKDHLSLLPKGKVLDLAMGEGRNGVFLATQGYQVTGLDISEIGLQKAQQLAKELGTQINTEVVDLETYQLPANTYDVIVCTYYLQRDLFPQMIQALKPGGVVVVETYTLDHLKYQSNFPRQFLLGRNELLQHFTEFTLLRYQLVDNGQAAYASLLAKKP